MSPNGFVQPLCRFTGAITASILTYAAVTGADADVVISGKPTKNMTCSDGGCSPTAAQAVLNVTDLENLLSSGSVTVTTTGVGVQAKDIRISAALSWASASMLTLDAYEAIESDKLVSVDGIGGLTILTDDGGSGGWLSFGSQGHVTFASTSDALSINGTTFMLVADVATLAGDIAANPGGAYALAANYDASVDGTYASSPIGTDFTGIFEGLGNEVSRLAINANTNNALVGFFSLVDTTGVVENFRLAAVTIKIAGTTDDAVGGLTGENIGSARDDTVTGSIAGGATGTFSGGLVGYNTGSIANSFGSVAVSSHAESFIGGLVGGNGNGGTISGSYASGPVDLPRAKHGASAGGLVGSNTGAISNSYATGTVTASFRGTPNAGGLVGDNLNTITDSYSTGAGAAGFIGYNQGNVIYGYWDTTTSGNENGCGLGDCSGVTGLTTAQLQSGLPPGFDPAIWGENANINDGLPYLLANPPAK